MYISDEYLLFLQKNKDRFFRAWRVNKSATYFYEEHDYGSYIITPLFWPFYLEELELINNKQANTLHNLIKSKDNDTYLVTLSMLEVIQLTKSKRYKLINETTKEKNS